MQVYEDRRSRRYLDAASRALDVERLLRDARPFDKKGYPNESQDTRNARAKYKARCDISFVGFAAANLFDQSGEYVRSNADPGVGTRTLAPEMERIFASHRQFEDANIWLRIRLLFLYPYSTHAMSVVNAATTTRRTAMDGDRVHPSEQQHLQVSADKFHGSTLYRSQQYSLAAIQRWIDKHNWDSVVGNSVEVRFTPISTNLCALIANDVAFCDSYLLAKEQRVSQQLAFSPITELSPADTGFARLEDHFRYLWQMNITLHCSDATKYPGPKSRRVSGARHRVPEDALAQVHQPAEITFLNKADHLCQTRKLTEDQKSDWRFRTERQFARYVTVPFAESPYEHVFVACAWEKSGTNRSGPSRLAELTIEWLERDVTSSVRSFRAEYMEGRPGESIRDVLYGMLDSSVLGIVLMTRKHRIAENAADAASANEGRPERWLSSSNVYHELGYLMSRLPGGPRANERILIGIEPGVEPPTNVADMVMVTEQLHLPRRNDDVQETLRAARFYCEVVLWLSRKSTLLADKPEVLRAALKRCIKRVEKLAASDRSAIDGIRVRANQVEKTLRARD